MAANYDLPSERKDVISQWVSEVTAYSSQYDERSWPASMVIGPPKVYPKYGDIPGAWASSQKDAHQYIELMFDRAVFITKIDIYETYHCGGVKAILGKNQGGQWVELYRTDSITNITQSRIFSPQLQHLDCPTREIRLNIDCTACNSWVEIDAVQLHGTCYRAASPPPAADLVDSLRTMVNNEQFSDVIFRVEGKVVFAHKVILCARSEYFRAMFREHTNESSTLNPIELKDVDFEGFMSILHYLYTNDIQQGVPCEGLPDVCRVADRFNVDGLKKLTAYRVSEMLNDANVIDTYVAATTQLPVLDGIKKTCLAYISSNMSKVVNTPSFERLPQDLMLEIVQAGTANLHV